MPLQGAEGTPDDMVPESDRKEFTMRAEERRHAPERDEPQHEQNPPNEKKTAGNVRDRPERLRDDNRAERHPTDRALGQKSEREREIKKPPPFAQAGRPNDHAAPGPAKPVAQQFVAGPMRQGHEKDQPHVGHRSLGVDESLEAEGENDRGPKPGASHPKTRAPAKNHDRSQRRRQRAGQPRRERVLAKEMITGDLTPIGEWWFVETITIVEIRHDIIATLDHLARSLGKTRLIAIHQRQRPGAGQMKKQAPAEEGEEIASCRLQESD